MLKLKEEVDEFTSDPTSEELADVLEVIDAIAEYKGMSRGEVERVKEMKARHRGKFTKRILLQVEK